MRKGPCHAQRYAAWRTVSLPHEIWDSHWSERRSLSGECDPPPPPSLHTAIVSATPLIGYSRVAGIYRSHDKSANRPSPMKPYRESLWPRASPWVISLTRLWRARLPEYWTGTGLYIPQLHTVRHAFATLDNTSLFTRHCINRLLLLLLLLVVVVVALFQPIANYPFPYFREAVRWKSIFTGGRGRRDSISMLINRLW